MSQKPALRYLLRTLLGGTALGFLMYGIYLAANVIRSW